MTTEEIFKQARESVSESLIRHYFDCEKSEVFPFRGAPNLKTLCPFRSDNSVGSFSINLQNGYWYDNSGAAQQEKGDFIHLVGLAYNLKPIEAAKKIIKDSGGDIKEVEPAKIKKLLKYQAVIPIPEEKLDKLNDHVTSKYIVEKFGEPVDGWKMRQPDGKVWMCVTRHLKDDGQKQDLPYKFCTDGKWHAGCPVEKNRHLFNIEKVKPDSKIIITEGNKCASVEFPNRVNISWWGGTNQTKNYDWKSLKDIEDIIIWPDYDIKKNKLGAILPDEEQPGLKTALSIQKKLPHAKILDVYPFGRRNEKQDGWDIFDAVEDSIDLQNFIEKVGHYEQSNESDSDRSDICNDDNVDMGGISDSGNIEDCERHTIVKPPFEFMGHDDGRHYFLANRSNIIKSIGFGSFSNGKLLELAPLSYWGFNFPKKDSFDLHCASDWIIDESEKKGYYKKENVRGAGVWMDEERIIINSGHSLFNESGTKVENLDTRYFYTHSQKQMGTFEGTIATEKQGEDLMNLFLAQGFETPLEAFIALGWTLIAPFAGILKWRPHIWITGPRSAGKSFMLENLIQPLLGEFVHVGSGKDTAPGIYRSVKSDPVPILLDEMEPGKNSNKDSIRKIEEKLELARNASSDFSGHITLANVNSGGSDSFFIRSPFCFSSIVPYMHGEAIESRILTCRLKNMSLTPNKIKTTTNFLANGLLDDPGIFRRKIFKNIRFTIKYIEILRKIITKETGEIRKADNLAPIFAATYSIVNEGKIPDEEKITEFVRDRLNEFDKVEIETDEDKLMRAIFDYMIRVNSSDNLSIAELIHSLSQTLLGENLDKDYDDALKRHGIKFHLTRDGVKFIAIATAHKQLQEILSETMYSGQYVQVMKRHTAYAKNMNISFAGQIKNAVLLRWDVIEDKYFKSEEEKAKESFIPF